MIGFHMLSGILILLITIVWSCNGENFPTSIKKCKNEDKKCIATTISDIIKRAATTGMPELGIKPINPYPLPKVNIERGQGAVILRIILKDASLIGIDCYVIDKINGFDRNPRDSVFELIGRCNSISIVGPYKMSGRFLLLPVAGEGMSTITFHKVNFTMNWQTDVETRDGKDYLKIKSVDYKSSIKRLHMNMENLFNNKALSDNMNTIFNENYQLIFNEIQEPVEKSFENILLDVIQPVFDKFPYNEMFAE
ncbi:Protein takeout [Pseudolycoriella hygida]|uniref:Protein takeout n=1 Tax=Pseudolycoriella hygida TaxID=35572 RepID=A0A9Q0MQN5_9DIPT|nr:Protein takeout [Pseudolycoriella hygida]